MNENSYLIGLEISKNISLFIWIIYFIYIQFDVYKDNTLSLSFRIRTIILVSLVSIGMFISSFLIIYPILNILLQNFQSIAFYKHDISQGTLGLRITSIILSLSFLKSFYNLTNNKFLENHRDLTVEYSDLQELTSFFNDDKINFIILFQNLFYGTITLVLWVFILLSKSFLELQVIIWGLFFIVDDWAIISDNLIALKGRLLKWHKFRIIFFNFFLFSFLISACFKQLDSVLFSILITFILGLLIILITVGFYQQTFQRIIDIIIDIMG